jgi:hypothetical protein
VQDLLDTLAVRSPRRKGPFRNRNYLEERLEFAGDAQVQAAHGIRSLCVTGSSRRHGSCSWIFYRESGVAAASEGR